MYPCVGFTRLRFHELMGQLSLLTEQIHPPLTHLSHPLEICTHDLLAGPVRPVKSYQPWLASYSKVQSFIAKKRKYEWCLVWSYQPHTQVLFRLATDTFTLIYSEKSHPIDWICVHVIFLQVLPYPASAFMLVRKSAGMFLDVHRAGFQEQLNAFFCFWDDVWKLQNWKSPPWVVWAGRIPPQPSSVPITLKGQRDHFRHLTVDTCFVFGCIHFQVFFFSNKYEHLFVETI